jgi:hypothetical protein
VREQHQERYEAEYLNMRLAFEGHFVTPLEPEALRPCLRHEVPEMYAQYQTYWQTLVAEWEVVQARCPLLARELRYGAMRGLVHPL